MTEASTPAEQSQAQSHAAWNYFLSFWKYFFALCVAILILLMIVGV